MPDKVEAMNELAAALDVAIINCAYVGDDIVDLGVMRRAGFAACVADGDPSVIAEADMVTKAAGGRGAVREVIAYLLRCQNTSVS